MNRVTYLHGLVHNSAWQIYCKVYKFMMKFTKKYVNKVSDWFIIMSKISLVCEFIMTLMEQTSEGGNKLKNI